MELPKVLLPDAAAKCNPTSLRDHQRAEGTRSLRTMWSTRLFNIRRRGRTVLVLKHNSNCLVGQTEVPRSLRLMWSTLSSTIQKAWTHTSKLEIMSTQKII